MKARSKDLFTNPMMEPHLKMPEDLPRSVILVKEPVHIEIINQVDQADQSLDPIPTPHTQELINVSTLNLKTDTPKTSCCLRSRTENLP